MAIDILMVNTGDWESWDYNVYRLYCNDCTVMI